MIRYCGIACICISIFILGIRVGYEIAAYHGSAEALMEAARLRVGWWMGNTPCP